MRLKIWWKLINKKDKGKYMNKWELNEVKGEHHKNNKKECGIRGKKEN